jgi:hypothetical protein
MIIKLRRRACSTHKKIRNAYTSFFGKQLPRRPERKWGDNIKIDL